MNLRPKPAIGGLNLPGSFPSISSSCWQDACGTCWWSVPLPGGVETSSEIAATSTGFKRVRHPQKHIKWTMFKFSKLSLKSILKVWINLYQNPHRIPCILMNFDTHFCINFDHRNAEMCCVCRGRGFEFHGGSCYLWSTRVVGGSSDSVLVDTLRRERSHIHTWGPFKGTRDSMIFLFHRWDMWSFPVIE